MTSKKEEIIADIEAALESGITEDTEGAVWAIIARRHDRSVQRVYGLATQVKKRMDKMLSALDHELSIVCSDFHVPFHHKGATEALLDLLDDLGGDVDNFIVNGDLLDAYSISRFHRDPRKPLLQEELDSAALLLSLFRERLPDARIVFLEGNHEERLSRLLKENPGLLGLRCLDYSHLLGLKELGIEHLPYKEHVTIHGDIQVTHGHIARKHSAYSAKGHLVDDGYQNVIHGHTHRLGAYFHTGVQGTRRAFEGGGFFDVEQADYLSNANWQNGFIVAKTFEGHHQIDMVEIDNKTGQFIYNNKVYGG